MLLLSNRQTVVVRGIIGFQQQQQQQQLVVLILLLIFIIIFTCIGTHFETVVVVHGLSVMSNNNNNNNKVRFITNKMCPYAQKAWIALELSGINYNLEEISLYGSNGKPDWFWKLNPAGTVPVLVIDNNVYPDSDEILNILHNKIPSSSTTIDDKEILKWRKTIMNEKVIPIGKRAVLGGSKKPLMDLLRGIEFKDNDYKFLCGNEPCIADCHAFPFLWRLQQEYGNLPNDKLNSWLQTCQQHSAFRKTIQSSWWWWW